MSILITGFNGYIGSRLYEKIGGRGIDRKINFDINGNSLRLQTYSPDVVYHLAAQAGAMPSWEDPYQDAMDNIMATIRICEMFPDAKLIFATSGAALDPESPYGLSKKTAEEYIKMLHPNAVILRLSSIYGEKDRGVVDNFIRGEKCNIYGDGNAVRDFVHVDDIVEALIKAKDWKPGTYEVGSGNGTSVKTIALGTGKPIEYKPARKGENRCAVLSNQTPNWEPKINVLEYVHQKCGLSHNNISSA